METPRSTESNWESPGTLKLGMFAVGGSIAGQNIAESFHINDSLGRTLIGVAVAGIASACAFRKPRSR